MTLLAQTGRDLSTGPNNSTVPTNFKCELNWSDDPAIGKVILVEDGQGDCVLYGGKCQSWSENLQNAQGGLIFRRITKMLMDREQELGYHENIKPQVNPVGGATCMRVGKILYVTGESKYGPVNLEHFIKCAKSAGFEVRASQELLRQSAQLTPGEA